MVTKEQSILIVDDEEMVRRPLRKKLSWSGYHCEEASNAEEALEKLKSNTPDLVILDIKMPGKSGIELLREIRASYPETPVIIATAVTETNVATQCMNMGAQDYICKPFSLDELMLSVYRAVDKKPRRLVDRSSNLLQHKEVESYTSPLTPREKEVINLIAQGYLNKQIANILGISDQTVKNHITSILEKLQVNRRTDAAIVALARGVLSLRDVAIQTRERASTPGS